MAISNTIQNSEDLSLSVAEIISYRMAGGAPGRQQPITVDIKNIILKISLDEDIYEHSMVGKIQIYDTVDVRTILPITGLERLNLKFNTPGLTGISAIANEGHPFHIYKIQTVVQDKDSVRSQAYDIFFCSRESYFNNMRRVSKAYEGAVELGVEDIFTSKRYLNSKKQLYVEPTKYKTKIVIPNLKPFAAIRMLCAKAVSRQYENAGFLFYETPDGYHFRSYESLFAMAGAIARPVKWHYRPQLKNIRNPRTGVEEPVKDMHGVNNWTLDKPVDVLKNLNAGGYANKSIEYDPFYKTINVTDYNYEKYFGKHFHTEHDGDGHKSDDKTHLPAAGNIEGSILSEAYEQRVFLSSRASKLHDKFNPIGAERSTQKIMSQEALLKNGVLTLHVPGNSVLQVGDIIDFEMPLFQPLGDNKPARKNPYWAGRYLITFLKHNVDVISGYTMTILAVKDNVAHQYITEHQSWRHQAPDGKTHNIYEQDKQIMSRLGPTGMDIKGTPF
jgi:hypothetical protein